MASSTDNFSGELTEIQQYKGRRNIIVTTVLTSIYSCSIGAAILNLFAVRIGMPLDKLGVMNAFGSLFAVIQLFLLGAIERSGKRRYVGPFWGLQAAFSLLFPLIPLIYQRFGSIQAINTLLLAIAVTSLFGNLGQAGWYPLVKDSVPDEITGRFIAKTGIAYHFPGIVYLMLAGIYLGSEPSVTRFTTIFIVGVAAVLVRQVYLIRIPEIRSLPKAEGARQVRAMVTPLLDGNYRRYLLFLVIAHFAVGLAAPFIVVYMKSRLGLSSSLVTVISSMEVVGAILTLTLWGRLCDRHGQRSVFGLSSILFCLVMLAWAGLGHKNPAIILIAGLVSLIRGVAVAGLNQGEICYVFHAAPKVNSTAYVTVPFIIGGLAMGAGPIVGGEFLLLMQKNAFILPVGLNPYSILFAFDALLILLAMWQKKRMKWHEDLSSIEVVGRLMRSSTSKFIKRYS